MDGKVFFCVSESTIFIQTEISQQVLDRFITPAEEY